MGTQRPRDYKEWSRKMGMYNEGEIFGKLNGIQ